ncbi:MAG: hypothetical protein IMF26_11070 [Candidatus Fermentithermobacillus carboniphilus]|uniref:PIN domain-containing protein n=1 Tax=Candidatus Fermentithermobacillus carboniphilus TaxID=3085328 RepID=A0AAT9LFB8_9FIRM|nr:MAG: hypothetical protein IMF26_11070 [Candidatus Fermentithermobacillus carboniphilus]
MSGEGAGLQFVDTNVLVYAHDRFAGQKCTRARPWLKNSGTFLFAPVLLQAQQIPPFFEGFKTFYVHHARLLSTDLT